MINVGISFEQIKRRTRACNYLTVSELYLEDNFFLTRPLEDNDIKPRLLGHWGTCPGINSVYANLGAYFTANQKDWQFILGPGHGFPALQANLFYDGVLETVDPKMTRDADGIAYLSKSFARPGGYPTHSSPFTPTVITEGGELGYALATAYGAALNRPNKTIAVLIGDGEFETATALASMNLVKLVGADQNNAKVLPILHLNGYKITGPTISGRKSDRELNQLIRGFGYHPITIPHDSPKHFQISLSEAENHAHPFLIFRNEKGATGPEYENTEKIAGNNLSHQIPLADAKTNPASRQKLEDWLKTYHFEQLFSPEKGFYD